MDAPKRGSIPIQDLFWAKVAKSDRCWDWLATKSADGYGRFWFDGAMVGSHRLAYEWANGPIPVGLYVDHICLNVGCVNVSHMRLTTNAQNGQNRSGAYANGSSGIRGVSWHKRDKRWVAYSTINRKRTHIGTYESKTEAAEAVSSWRREHMPYSEMDKKKEVS